MIANGYKDTEIGIIPVEWEVEKLSEICKFKQGIQIPLEEQSTIQVSDTIRFIRISDYTQNTDDIRYVSKDYSDYMISKDDVVMVRYGETAGFIGTNLSGVLANNLFSINPNEKISKKYLYTYMNDEKIYNYLKSLRAAGAMPAVSFKSLNVIKIPLPPLEEQKQIADILSTADYKIDAIASQIEKTETLKKGLLQKLLSEGIGHSKFKDSKLGKIPDSWEVVKIVEVLDLMTDYVANGSFASLRENTTVYDSKEYAYYVRLFDLRKGLGHDAQKYVDEPTYGFLNKSFLEGNEILIANIGANVGESFLMPILEMPSTLAPNMIELKLNYEKMTPLFCFNYLKSGIGLSELDKVIEGSGQPKINKTKLKTVKIPLPPLEEQKQIANILSTADKKLELLKAKKEKYETLKKGLLQKLLSGEVRVKDI
jgi:type I restriction enzyme, S subunit